MGSRSLGSRGPRNPHLVRPGGGLRGEVQDLRKDVDEAFTALESELPVPGATTQLAWYIDPVDGDDANDGSSGAPLKTWAEFRRRIGREIFTDAVTVNIAAGTIAEDIVIDGGFMSFPKHLIIRGTRTVLYEGSITGYVAYNVGGQQVA